MSGSRAQFDNASHGVWLCDGMSLSSLGTIYKLCARLRVVMFLTFFFEFPLRATGDGACGTGDEGGCAVSLLLFLCFLVCTSVYFFFPGLPGFPFSPPTLVAQIMSILLCVSLLSFC